MTQKKPSNADRRRIAQAKIAEQRRIEARRQRRITIAWVVAGVVVLAGAGTAATFAISSTNKDNAKAAVAKQASDPSIDKSSNLLATTADQSTGDTVDGVVKSNSMETTVYHIHAHLQIYVNGVQKNIPYGVGIMPPYSLSGSGSSAFVSGGSKFYFLHTHDETGVIHVESPSKQEYTLGNFFDLWKQPLSTTQVGPNKGTVTVFVDGKKYTGDPTAIKLTAYEKIQLDVGTVTPYKDFTWPSGY
ncbi:MULTISPECIES: hypothetical protein [Streptacidiphilus]|uniref:DUF4115 domain-containing protein n=1 Tax=Streptacidiphilus cavernicola TaxID=3342716 RepID=A0ABV6UUN1_9ACTN|nr:hypothetical protein [Streptacidiphilus jeojiense]